MMVIGIGIGLPLSGSTTGGTPIPPPDENDRVTTNTDERVTTNGDQRITSTP